MSYARWNAWSDVYVYETEEGYVVHVAVSRPINPEVMGNKSFGQRVVEANGDIDIINEEYQQYRRLLTLLEYEEIGLQFDGQTFCEGELQSLYRLLGILKGIGYRVPEATFDMILDEICHEQDMGWTW